MALNSSCKGKVRLSRKLKKKWEGEVINAEGNWYVWNGVYWQSKKEIFIKQDIAFEIYDFHHESAKMHVVNSVYQMLAFFFLTDSSFFKNKMRNCINFQNGILLVQDNPILIPHNKDYRLCSVLNYNYQPDAFPSPLLQTELLNLVGHKNRNLNLLRAAIRRAIQPCRALQAGFWIFGPPGSGKSTFTSWIKRLLGQNGAEFSCAKSNLFDRSRLRDASAIILSEGETFSSETSRFLKTLIGRDEIIYHVKHQQIYDTFSSEAVVFITSNFDLGSCSPSVQDPGLMDRLFEIEFPNVLVNSKIDFLECLDKILLHS